MHCFSHVLHPSFILSSIASCFITFMHFYGFFVPPWSSLIIFMSLGWSFLASCTLCQSWQKGGEIVETLWFFFFKILHVRGRNTFFCKGEMCFILLGGVLTSFFLYISLVTMFTYIVVIFDIYTYIYIYIWCMFLSPTFTCAVSFLSLCICFLLFVYNLLFLFHTKMSWWVLFKVFQKYKLSKSTCHKLYSCKVFQEFVLG